MDVADVDDVVDVEEPQELAEETPELEDVDVAAIIHCRRRVCNKLGENCSSCGRRSKARRRR